MDLDADGINDILSGCYSQSGHDDMVGSFWVLKGLGEGKFAKPTELMGTDGKLLCVHSKLDDRGAQMTENICTRPFAVDWDGDGDLDIVSGNFKGTFFVFTGEGKGKFQPKAVELKDANGDALKVSGVHSDPFVIDWDGDGDLDLVASSSTGEVIWAENTAGSDKPAAPTLSAFRTLIAAPGQSAKTPRASVEYTKGINDAYYLLDHGKVDEGEAAFQKLIESEPKLPDAYYHLACAYSRRASTMEGDEKEKQIIKTIKALSTAIEKGWTGYAHMERDPDMDLLRDRDDYLELLKSMTASKEPAGPAGSTRMWITDVNGDGRLDIIVGDRFSSGGQMRTDLTDEEKADYKAAMKEQSELQETFSETYGKYREEYEAAVKTADPALSKEEQAKLWRDKLAEPERKAFMDKYYKDMGKINERLTKYKVPYVSGGHVWLYKAKGAEPKTGN
ncbi:MAG: VCBS repeat-containing protein [Planctomycetes bacterium]|nr:VCBS repeat-containing protein [Planctomycetota bacterium]